MRYMAHQHHVFKLPGVLIGLSALCIVIAAHAGGYRAAGGGGGGPYDETGSHIKLAPPSSLPESATTDQDTHEDLAQDSGGFGFLLVPNCQNFSPPGTNQAVMPFGAGGTGLNQSCNPSDLSGPSQRAGQIGSLAEEDTKQPPATSSSYIFGGSSLSSPERPNGAPIFPTLYPPNTSVGSLLHPNGTGSMTNENSYLGAQNSVGAQTSIYSLR
jgi:hypothetical protein